MARLPNGTSSARALKLPSEVLVADSVIEVDMMDGVSFKGQVLFYDKDMDWFALLEEKENFFYKRMINVQFVRQVSVRFRVECRPGPDCE